MVMPLQILKQAASVYTHEVYEKFKEELCKGIDCLIENGEEVGTEVMYKITPQHKHRHHLVRYDASKSSVSCSCKKFEFAGILCTHILKVFTTLSITRIPDEYILKHWTKDAKTGMAIVCRVSTSKLDDKAQMSARY